MESDTGHVDHGEVLKVPCSCQIVPGHILAKLFLTLIPRVTRGFLWFVRDFFVIFSWYLDSYENEYNK